MRQKRFIQSIIKLANGYCYITAADVDALQSDFDFVDVSDEEADQHITFLLSELWIGATVGNTKTIYDCAKSIKEVMRDCHMI